MDLMCRHFYVDPSNAYLLNISQLVRTCWRDERAPRESLLHYHQRMQQHQREAAAYYDHVVAPLARQGPDTLTMLSDKGDAEVFS